MMHRTPAALRWIFPRYEWKINHSRPTIYLTFDDGPVPDATLWVLNVLKKYQIKATFFCVGDNVRKHPEVFTKVINEGHAIGNHTFNHLNGWKNEQHHYIKNFERCEQIFSDLGATTNLFRPPYGKIKSSQANFILKTHRIIMWDLLSADFSPKISKETCLEQTLKYSRPGSIILFHDSIKTIDKLRFVLPAYLSEMKSQGYSFGLL